MNWQLGVCGVLLTAGTLGWLALLWRMFVLRNEFEIAARSPNLVILNMLVDLCIAVSVLLHWLLRSMGKTMPCYVIYWVSYAMLVLAAAPFVIRVVRLVVAFHKPYRAKYTRFVKMKFLLGVWAAVATALTIRATIRFNAQSEEHRSRDARECFYWDDVVVVGGSYLVGWWTLFLARIRVRENDNFKIREELMRTIGGCLVLLGIIEIIQVLILVKALSDKPQLHIACEVLALLFAVNAGTWSLLVPMMRSRHVTFRGLGGVGVIPLELCFDVENTSGGVDGSLLLAQNGGKTANLFGKFCQKSLCMESWDFVLDAINYETVFRGPEEQFEAFLYIVEQYMLPSSPHELNLSGDMSEALLPFTTREAFEGLGDEGRRTILGDALKEICRMLDQNLHDRFNRQTAQEEDKELTFIADGDKELIHLMRVSSRKLSDTNRKVNDVARDRRTSSCS